MYAKNLKERLDSGVCIEIDLTRLGYWTYARRKFIEAQRQQPKDKV